MRELAPLIEILRFDSPSQSALDHFNDAQWRRLLAAADPHHLTLALARCAVGRPWPTWVHDRLRLARDASHARISLLRDAAAEITEYFRRHSIECVLLKGLAHAEDYSPDPAGRMQFDIDIYCPPGAAGRACDALDQLGYRAIAALDGVRSGHLTPMARPTGWVWNGDFFDPGIPAHVELHTELWSAAEEGFEAPGIDEFWGRRITDGAFSVFRPADEFAFRALHLLRHLLHANLRTGHVYELAWFLANHTGDGAFWDEWRGGHPGQLRALAAVSATLAQRWFGCQLPAAVQDEAEVLPPPVRLWFDHYAFDPLDTRAGKSEIWLYLALTQSKWRVLSRRLFPARIPSIAEADYVPKDQLSPRRRVRQLAAYTAYTARRAALHTGALPRTLVQAVGWWWRTAGLGAGFLTFLGAASLYNFGMFLFVLVYNLYLLDLGHTEQLLGWVASAATAGSIAGALPAGWLGRSIGLQRTVLICFTGSALIFTLRSFATGPAMLIGEAFLAGILTALWMVSMAPVIARLTTPERRPLGFSLFFGSGISLGIAGGLLGGRLPGWLAAAYPGIAPADAKRATLLAGCAFLLLAAMAASRLQVPAGETASRRQYPRGRFIGRYLAIFAVWNLATGAFNPFFNAFFARLGATVEQIGFAFSGGQLAQLFAMALAPFLYRRFGLVAGITGAMILTAASLGGLAVTSAVTAAMLAYCACMAFQWMSEPGIYTLLMNHVRAEEQSGAAALNFLTIASAQAVAAAVAGAGLERYGYPTVLAIAGVIALAAALLLRSGLAAPAQPQPDPGG